MQGILVILPRPLLQLPAHLPPRYLSVDKVPRHSVSAITPPFILIPYPNIPTKQKGSGRHHATGEHQTGKG